MNWVSKRVLKLIDKKHKLYIYYKRNRIPYEVYKAYANLLSIVLERLRKSYYKRKLTNSNESKTWSVINEILGRDRKFKTIKEIQVDGETVTETKIISQKFCEHFASIPITTQSKLNEPINSYADLIPINENAFHFRHTTPVEIEKIIMNLKKKGRGLPAKFLKLIKHLMSPILCKLFNMCIEQAIYPQSFKMARVTPLHKSGTVTDIKNYRPISTLINLNKILEKLMLGHFAPGQFAPGHFAPDAIFMQNS